MYGSLSQEKTATVGVGLKWLTNYQKYANSLITIRAVMIIELR
jgi:hypothetical protein